MHSGGVKRGLEARISMVSALRCKASHDMVIFNGHARRSVGVFVCSRNSESHDSAYGPRLAKFSELRIVLRVF